jgi:hypothetical protein
MVPAVIFEAVRFLMCELSIKTVSLDSFNPELGVQVLSFPEVSTVFILP